MAVGRAHVLLSGALDDPQCLHLNLIPTSPRGGHKSLHILQLALVVFNLSEHPHCEVIYLLQGPCHLATLPPALGRTLPTVSSWKPKAPSLHAPLSVDYPVN